MQVNGTSVVTDGVANVPVATTNDYGVTREATTSDCKSGSTARMVSVRRQYASAFYGLADAASDTTQSASSNPVGTYTDAAKVAIQKMLGIQGRRLLKTGTLEEAASYIAFETDKDGLPFRIDDIEIILCIPKTPNGTRNIVYSIETSSPTPTGARWVATIPNATSTTRDTITHSIIKRYSLGWRGEHHTYTLNASGDYSGAISTEGGQTKFSMNGASWIRTNNPLYATKFAFQLNGEDLSEGTYYEIYAHDYIG